MGLADRIAGREDGLLLFSITPPRRSTSPEEAQRIADVTIERLQAVDVDGLILYDIDDESDRNPNERPFPYLPTKDPAAFYEQHLGGWEKPVVVYRCVGKYEESELTDWLAAQDPAKVLTTFVGASTGGKVCRTDLPSAQKLWHEVAPTMRLGGVAIPERHSHSGGEHSRLIRKQQAGTSFFVTQVVYDTSAAKSMVSDYFYACEDAGLKPVPVIFTLSVVGSMKTVEFLEWLGVDVPRWVRNDLSHAPDPLATSYDQCILAARELTSFCEHLGMPHGFNVESVSIRKAEIEASVRLASHLRTRRLR
ncbi:hypothetical protein GOEFS_014_00030 [Gordonia effusa NBRC 100432]|uniref:Methylenetetrahydrofolate reductase (NAD(P)H) n=1 Tax=Gordonia effusa NBRC 100432 TaxID=1077974 RepID=H0QVB0_9ACTN|nr:methylenetetrahydrofolate reductase [Gordonia effusa]GAB16761.1 hypothetical protein GOEFS_014_00030 [Gordonia effusa NBRC 100432]